MLELEQPTRLSQSRLWELLRHGYERRGPDAWLEDELPTHITTNPYMARSIAEVLFALLDDLAQAAEAASSAERINILELGSGTGQLGFALLLELQDLVTSAHLETVPYRIVLSDFTESNVVAMVANEQLRPFVEQGVLDFALFDVSHPVDPILRVSGEHLLRDATQPLVVIANYVFDAIPPDAFRVQDGGLVHCRFGMMSKKSWEELLLEPDPLQHVALREVRESAEGFYGSTELDEVVSGHLSMLQDTTFLFPVQVLRFLDWLVDNSSGRVMLLACDKGFVRPGSILGDAGLPLVKHLGVFSMLVNFYAIEEFIRRNGGEVEHAPLRDATLVMMLATLGLPMRDMPHCHLSFQQRFQRFNPRDYHDIYLMQHDNREAFSLQEIYSMLRLSQWDPLMLLKYRGVISQLAGELEGWLRQEWIHSLERVWANHLRLSGPGDEVALTIGYILRRMGSPAEALRYLQICEPAGEITEKTAFHQALCRADLNQQEEAIGLLEVFIRCQPDHQRARELRYDLIRQLHWG